MTYGQLIKAIQSHRGTLYACINAEGGQFHVPAMKTQTIKDFLVMALRYGKDCETGLTIDHRGHCLYLDTVDPNAEDEQ